LARLLGRSIRELESQDLRSRTNDENEEEKDGPMTPRLRTALIPSPGVIRLMSNYPVDGWRNFQPGQR
jgi:hypothetical protein